MYIYDFLIENQLNAGLIDDALETAKKAGADFPKEAKYLHLTATIYKTYKNIVYWPFYVVFLFKKRLTRLFSV